MPANRHCPATCRSPLAVGRLLLGLDQDADGGVDGSVCGFPVKRPMAEVVVGSTNTWCCFFQSIKRMSSYGAKGFGDVAVAPSGTAPAGYVERWVSAVDRNDPEFGEPGTGEWVTVEDHQKDDLFTESGDRYEIGSDHNGQSYDGLGPISSWLSTEAPEPEPLPPVYPQFTALEMLDLFTDTEQLAVVEATMAVPAVKLWYDRLIAATFVTYEDPRTEGGLQALVTAGLLTPNRKTEIVAAMQPETEPT